MTNNLTLISAEFNQSRDLLDRFVRDQNNLTLIDSAASIMSTSLMNGKKIIACGNGGSHCDAAHFAEELTGKFRKDRKPWAAIAIADSAYLTCAANDYGYENVFSRFVEAMGSPNDCLLAVSCSGNSQNVIHAVNKAKEKGIYTIVLTGNDGGLLKDVADICIVVPHHGFADRIQEVHIKIIHIFILLIEKYTGTD